MLNPNDPLQVTLAFGGAIGVRVSRVGVYLQGLRQSHNGNAGADLTAEARTFWGVGLEYEASRSGLHESQGLVQFGTGRLQRPHFQTAWYVQGGMGLRYRLAPMLAVVGSVQDFAAFLPLEAARCEPLPGGGELCTGAVEKQIQHNIGFLIALEITP